MKLRWNHRRAYNREIGKHTGCILSGRLIAIGLTLVLCLISVSCSVAETFEPVRATVTEIDQFGDIMLDLEQISLEYGDSVDLCFSGGYAMKAVPYYPVFLEIRTPLY